MLNDPLGSPEHGESHRDAVLATFAALKLSLNTPIILKSENLSLADLLSESIANFWIGQEELTWTATAYATYLPPRTKWVNRYREQTSFSQLTRTLLDADLRNQSCAGTHTFEALAKIHEADHKTPILTQEIRHELNAFLLSKLTQITTRQEKNGTWNWNWCEEHNRKAPSTFRERILVTGHLLEAILSVDPSLHPPPATLNAAAQWLREALVSPKIDSEDGGSWVCPYTHAARAYKFCNRLPRGQIQQ